MKLRWTFGQKIAGGFAAVVALTLISSVISVHALRTAVDAKDRVIDDIAAILIDAAKLQAAIERQVASVRGFLITGNQDYLRIKTDAETGSTELLRRIESRLAAQGDADSLNAVVRAERDYSAEATHAIEMRTGSATTEEVSAYFETNVTPRRRALSDSVERFVQEEEARLKSAKKSASTEADGAIRMVMGIGAGVVLLACVIAVALSRILRRDIGAAIEHIRSSSAELQAAANQQVTGSREQATSMNEISTTVSELLATSRQIAESAQRVAQIAEETADAAGKGDRTVGVAHESILAIKQHVDQVVAHMLDLGRKSQQIGGVVEIINELAEQTNILSINASIEAAGSSEGGRRFGVVADEIRRLAERVASSTREIGGIIEEIRSAVNTTVMATETGAKAAETGARQFGELTAAFSHIAKLVVTSTDAAREIELSTKQQATAVEQVNGAVVNAAQATRETEASSNQTLQTANQLTTLSQSLAQLV